MLILLAKEQSAPLIEALAAQFLEGSIRQYSLLRPGYLTVCNRT
jgi:hypothetical protein